MALVVLAAFIQAPFLHIHLHEATQGHPGPFFHLHLKWAHAVSQTPEFQGLNPDDDAQYEGWFRATPTTDSGSIHPAVIAEPFSPAAPEIAGWTVEAPLPAGHDPPGRAPLNSRAPPA
jgi:hypothetical protein